MVASVEMGRRRLVRVGFEVLMRFRFFQTFVFPLLSRFFEGGAGAGVGAAGKGVEHSVLKTRVSLVDLGYEIEKSGCKMT